MENKIRVSIIIPAYNVEKYIARCVKSVMNQTLKEIEILVINDGSSDNTQDIIETLSKNDSRVILVNKKNAGVSSARNTGLDIAKGEYIQHLDGDDWIEKEACDTLYTYAKTYNSDIVVSDYFIDYDNGHILLKKEYVEDEGVNIKNDYLNQWFEGQVDSFIWSKFIRREIHADIRPVNSISFGEDAVVLPRLLVKSKTVNKINFAYIHYIQSSSSITRSKASLKLNDWFNVNNFLREEFTKSGETVFLNKLNTYQLLSINSFMFYEPFFHNKQYRNNCKLIIKFLKEHRNIRNPKKIENGFNLFLNILKFFPNKLTLITLIKIANIIIKIKNNSKIG